MAKVFIASPIRSCVNGAASVSVEADSLKGAMDRLVCDHPNLRQQLYDDAGTLLNFVHLFVNGNQVHDEDGFSSRLGDGDTVEITLAVCGGCEREADGGVDR